MSWTRLYRATSIEIKPPRYLRGRYQWGRCFDWRILLRWNWLAFATTVRPTHRAVHRQVSDGVEREIGHKAEGVGAGDKLPGGVVGVGHNRGIAIEVMVGSNDHQQPARGQVVDELGDAPQRMVSWVSRSALSYW